MKRIYFTPDNFQVGKTYTAQLLFDGSIVATITNLVEDQEYYFEVSTPGSYVIKLTTNLGDLDCNRTRSVQALFPIVTFTESAVNCDNNTYNFNITLTNPTTAGSNVRYGYSNFNDCSTVASWSTNPILTIPADSVVRYVFVRNNVVDCCYLISPTVEDPCVICDLDITNISFSCS